jgi:hypothetical protein
MADKMDRGLDEIIADTVRLSHLPPILSYRLLHAIHDMNAPPSRINQHRLTFLFRSAPIDLATPVAKVADVNPVMTTLAMALERLVSPQMATRPSP